MMLWLWNIIERKREISEFKYFSKILYFNGRYIIYSPIVNGLKIDKGGKIDVYLIVMFSHAGASAWFARVAKRYRVNAIKRQGSRAGEKSTRPEGIPFREDAARWWNAMRGDVRGVHRPISARLVSGAENCAHVTLDSISTPWASALRCAALGLRGRRGRGRVETGIRLESWGEKKKTRTEVKRDKATKGEL